MSEVQDMQKGARIASERLLKAVALMGGFALFGIMLLVSISVFFRYALNRPILGDQELVEIGMALVVMMAMPFATLKGEHIRVDILDNRLGEVGRFAGDVFARCISCFVLFLLIGKTWDKMLDAYEYDDVTNMIEIPIWIAYGAITLGMGLVAVVMAVQLLVQLSHGVKGYE